MLGRWDFMVGGGNWLWIISSGRLLWAYHMFAVFSMKFVISSLQHLGLSSLLMPHASVWRVF
jgi:hypothetical protein